MKSLKMLLLASTLSLAVTVSAGAGIASAAKLHAAGTVPTYPAIVEGYEAGSGHTFDISAGEIHCETPKFEGGLTGPQSVLKTETYDTKCVYWENVPLEMKGCDFTFYFGSDAGHFGRYSGTAEIGPVGCGPVTLNSSRCQVTIPAQDGFVASYENLPGNPHGEVAISVENTALEYTQQGTHCAKGTFVNGEYRGAWTLRNQQGGEIYVEEDPHTPMFEAEQYPATETGAQDAANPMKIKVQGNTITCKEVGYNGTLTAAATSTFLTPSYSNCTVAGFSGTGNANGCSLVLYAGESLGGGKYQGQQRVTCPAGKAIEFVAHANCKISIPEQGFLGVVNYETTTISGQEAVKAAFNISGLKYTVTGGFLCPLTAGTFTNGTQTGGLTLQGKTSGGALQGLRIGG